MADGDVEGADRRLSSEENIALRDSATFEKLLDKHPTPSRRLEFPEPQNENSEYVVVSDKAIHNLRLELMVYVHNT